MFGLLTLSDTAQSMDNMERVGALATAGGGAAGTVSMEASSGYSAFAEVS